MYASMHLRHSQPPRSDRRVVRGALLFVSNRASRQTRLRDCSAISHRLSVARAPTVGRSRKWTGEHDLPWCYSPIGSHEHGCMSGEGNV